MVSDTSLTPFTIRYVSTKWLAAAVLFVLVWVCYLPGNFGCADSMWSIPTAVSLLDHGDANLDEYLPMLRERQFAFILPIHDHYYTIYPLGTSIMAIPAIVVLRPIAAAIVRHAPRLWKWLEAGEWNGGGCPPVAEEPLIALRSWTEHLIASGMVAATAVIILLIAAEQLPIAAAIGLAILFAFGTSSWSSASRGLWQHGPSMLILSLALLLQLRGGRVLWIGVVLGFGYVVRPTDAIPLAAAGAWVLLSRPRELPGFVLGALVAVAPFLWYSRAVYGTWLPPYYQPGFYSRNVFKAEALAGLLVSPSRGLLVFSPVFLLAPVGLLLKAAARRLTLLDLSLAGCVAVHWVVISTTNGNWWGGASYGPRLFTDLVPYLIYSLIPVVAWVASARGAARGVMAATIVLLIGVSIAIHAQGALNPAAAAWNALPTSIDFDPVRVWDWRRPQFLAGITFTPASVPPVDLTILACRAPPGTPGQPFVVENDGGTVVLRWDPAPGPVAVYNLEVGSRPGLSDNPPREARDVLRPSVTARRVPPATYYVRVRGRNRCGDGPSSPETAVTVR
jgi:hypothetical protein